MRTNNVILLTILAIFIIAIGIMAGMSITNNNNNTNTSNITNNTTNITLNETNNTTNETAKTTTKTKTTTKNNQKKSSDQEYGDYINDEWVSMSEKEYAERYPALYHEESLQKGKYDKYHPEFYEVDRENGRI